MGVVSGHRGGGGGAIARAADGDNMNINGVSSSSSSATSTNNNKKKWSNLMPVVVAIVVIVEIAFLGRLDMANNAAMVHTWTKSFYYDSLGGDGVSNEDTLDIFSGRGESGGLETNNSIINGGGGGTEAEADCEAWLEKMDAFTYSRDFWKQPITVTAPEEEQKSCAVGCKFRHNVESNEKADAAFGLLQDPAVASVLRSMESAQYYSENNIVQARRRGYTVIMTTSLSSDVPVGYFSWAEYDIMAPLQPKTESALAAAFISNCGARNFRLQALEMLEKSNIKIDSYGGCHRNHDGRVDKVETLKRYKFSLAFENSNEEDYVTEKFFQSLVAGTIPVVVGAPNIFDFAPSPSSILHIKELKDAASVAKTMMDIAANPQAFNQSLRWKYEGPSDYFKALVDMAAVHSSCRLCIHLATKIWESEEKRVDNRPCKCTRGGETVYHLYVRERGRFKMESIFLRSSNMTLEALESAVLAKFKSLNHIPIWKDERPLSIRGGNDLKIYRMYPVGMTQRQALYTFRFKKGNFWSHIESNPCAKLEVIFV